VLGGKIYGGINVNQSEAAAIAILYMHFFGNENKYLGTSLEGNIFELWLEIGGFFITNI